MKFFFDNNLSPCLARALHCLNEPEGHVVVHLRDNFSPDISDEGWIEVLGAETGWIAFTFDKDVVRKAAIKAAWKKAKLIGFVLRPAWQSFPPMEQAWRMIKFWPTIVTQCKVGEAGSAYELGIKGGKIPTL